MVGGYGGGESQREDKAPEKTRYIKHHIRGWETGGVVAPSPAYLGGLAHLLLELSSHAIVLLNAQRKRLGRFLRLQLRLVREKRKENNDLKLRVPSHKPEIRTGCNNILPYHYCTTIPFSFKSVYAEQ